MKAKSFSIFILLLNLAIGNFITYLFSPKSDGMLACFLVHVVFSIVAISIILLLMRFLQNTHNRLITILFSILASFLVPTISIYLLVAGYGLYQLEFIVAIKAVPIAIISGIVSWILWLPIGIINSVFFIAYINSMKDESSA